MARKRNIPHWFALPSPPPERIEVAGRGYRLLRVFKHDFFAATCLYTGVDRAGHPRAPQKLVVKYGREQPLLGISLGWYARLIRRHEGAIYRALSDVEGVPRWMGRVGAQGYAIEYVEGRPLDHYDRPPPGFFDRLIDLLRAVHDHGVAYVDANKRSNILVGPGGEPFLVDYQISFRRREDWPWPLRWLNRRAFAYVAQRDLYHVYKHKRRMAPDELTEEEEALSRRRTGLHRLHRKLTKPWRALRRRFLRKQHRGGNLVSPTEHLEDHHQPEKATWRES